MITDKTTILQENKIRTENLNTPYDPIKGIGSPIERFEFQFDRNETVFLPIKMKELNVISESENAGSFMDYINQAFGGDKATIEFVRKMFDEIRFNYDFEYWAYKTIKIEHKELLIPVPFKLNRGQRKYLKEIWKQAGVEKPIRIVLDKARQWGGSTLTEIFAMWIQNRIKKNWHFTVCAQDDGAAKHIRRMYSFAAENYPKEYGEISLASYERTKNMINKTNGGIIGVGSVNNPDQFRSYNYPMIHLSEVAFWGDTEKQNARKLAQGLKSGIRSLPWTMIVEESTARGVGNFFYDEYIDAEKGKSGYLAVFVAWFENDFNIKPIDDVDTFINEMIKNTNFIPGMPENYHWRLWDLGCTLEQINWYKDYKITEKKTDIEMYEEYPSTAQESFVSSNRRAFPPDYIENLRPGIREPLYYGDILADARSGKEAFNNIRIEKFENGNFAIWSEPDNSIQVRDRYLVIVDIGGTTKKADWSVIRVFDRYWEIEEYGVMETAAMWVGHLDQDLVAWKAAQIAQLYGNALLVVERNSLKSQENKYSEEPDLDHSLTILDEIVEHYDNIYARNRLDKVKEGRPLLYGFMTDRSTKPAVIDTLRKYMREKLYIERDVETLNEADVYEQKPNGKYGAMEGKHDDRLMTAAIGCYIDDKYMDKPRIIKKEYVSRDWNNRPAIGMSDF